MARRTLNIPFNVNQTTTTQATASTDLLAQISDAGIETRPGMTIVRIRGYVSIKVADGSVGQQNAVAMALMMFREGGAATTPALFTEIVNAIWRLDTITRGIANEIAAGNFDSVNDIYPIETRGMRKIGSVGDELRMVVAAGGGVSTTFHASGTVRLLLEG